MTKAQSEGRYKGRQPTAQAKANEVLALRRKGIGGSEIASTVGISRASVCKIIANADCENSVGA